ncbi:amidase family protein [Balneola sp. MJW-20]|uniref:amidase family protein n=1 Tax=Gracilimonas aurantiaca TaxID=3234185 RepID=UPI0034672AB6
MEHLSFSEAQKKLSSGEIKLTDLVSEYRNRIEERNEEVNAMVFLNFDQAMEDAVRIQHKIDDGTAGSLAGMVMGIKDLIAEKGKKTTCASHILSNFESIYDATVIERLRAEDAIFIGRTNMDEFAMGSANQYSHHGPAKNPVDLTKVPGGSSGGSAAAVADNMVMAALGSDTGGSIRQPAAYCGIVGLKPTYGRVSRYGLVAFASSFDCIGPMTSNVEDAARILQVIAGYDKHDNTSSSQDTSDYLEAVRNPDAGIKIGVPEEYFSEGLDPEIRTGIEEKLDALKEKGAELIPISLPHTKYAIAIYYILATAEASSNLARYDGIRFGHRADKEKVMDDLNKEEAALTELIAEADGQEKINLQKELGKLDSPLIRLYKKSRTEGFGPEVKRRIMLGTYVLSSGYYDAYYGKAQKVRRLVQEDFKKAFDKVDVIVSPTAPTTAFDAGSKMDDPVQMYLNDVYTISANLAGICGISVPAGIHSDGLPYGIQFMADAFREDKVLNAGRLIEQL